MNWAAKRAVSVDDVDGLAFGVDGGDPRLPKDAPKELPSSTIVAYRQIG